MITRRFVLAGLTLLTLLCLIVLIAREGVKEATSPEDAEVAGYRKACDGQDAEACFNLGVRYGKGEGVTQDSVKAVEFYRKACDGGQNAPGCFSLGWMYYTNRGVRQSVDKALTFFGRACDLKSELGCQFYSRLKTEKK